MEVILSLVASALFIYVYSIDLQIAFRNPHPWRTEVVKASVFLIFIIVLSLVVIYNNIIQLGSLEGPMITFGSVFFSGAISILWIRHIRSIDIFEPERKKHLAITFVLSCLTIWLVFPISNQLNDWGFQLNGEGLNDFLYCVIGIGAVEEFVKIIPVFLLLRFSHQINEPIDFIVYGTTSALGFAFIENIMYIHDSELFSISGRMLYSSVAHMFDTSLICYGLGLDLIKKRKHSFLRILFWFSLASLAHGFYDFWLINEKYYNPIFTTFFLIISLHIWVLLKNNLLNFSQFYDKNVQLNRNKLKYRLIVHLSLVVFAGAVFISIVHGERDAIYFLKRSMMNYLFLIVFLAFSLSSYNVIPGFMEKLKLPNSFMLPKVDAYPDYSGMKVKVLLRQIRSKKQQGFEGELRKRIVIDQDINWYLFEGEGSLSQFLLKPLSFDPFKKGVPKKMLMSKSKRFISLSDVEIEEKDVSKSQLVVVYEKS